MQTTLIDQGLSLMLYGMGTVFVFLTLLVFATMLMSRLTGYFSPQQSEQTTAGTPPSSPSPQVLEAIRLAIAKHRQSKS
jgi:oxaloacetate decarboxylase gamma subunit